MKADFSLFVQLTALAGVARASFVSTPVSQLARQARQAKGQSNAAQLEADVDPSTLYPTYNLSVPIDHFQNESKYEPHTNGSFGLRYWFDASNYAEGGPVFVLAGGETSGSDRLPYLQKGILSILAKATNGLGVILEHRYYGESWPTSDLSTESLRFLTTDQALADTAYFASNVAFEGLEDFDLSPTSVPWIAYGGSYAGAFVAFLRKIYPEVFFGAISSSGVTKAIYDYWEYYEPIRQYGGVECMGLTQNLTHAVDTVLLGSNATAVKEVQRLFGLGGIVHSKDFANTLSYALGSWQSRNWDPTLNDPTFSYYCGNLTSDTVVYPGTVASKPAVEAFLTKTGYGASLVTPMLNYIGYLNVTVVNPCVSEGQTVDACFNTYDAAFYAQSDISQTWRSWPYQYCTEWGYLATGSGYPKDQLPIVSRTIDLDYLSVICKDAFNITTPSDTEIINKHGGFNISYPRLAIVDGQADPWRPATPHSLQAPNRTSTTSEPFILIEGAVHHWDENGLFSNETTSTLPPRPIVDVHSKEVEFVEAWLTEWKPKRTSKPAMAWNAGNQNPF